MRTADEIVDLVARRKKHAGSEQTRMDEVRRLYNGDTTVDLPELQADEHVVAANLAQLATDQMAMRVASVTPAVAFSVDRLGSSTATNKARDKSDVILYDWWARSRVLTHVLPRRARWFFAFSVAPVMLRPDQEGRPRWYDRHPIGTYPASVSQVGDIVPENVAFTYQRSGDEMVRCYPDKMWRICGGDMKRIQPSYHCVEYVDCDQITTVVLGHGPESEYLPSKGSPFEVLHSVPNRTGRPLAVLPGRITLDRPLGQFDGLIGTYQYEARLMALYMIAQERAIFPETWIVSQPGFPQAQVIVPADPKEGIVGEIQGGSIQTITAQPSPMTPQLIDRLEYYQRSSGAIPSEFSGQSGSNIRTGRRGDAVMSAAVDYRLQEAQQIFEASLEEENRIAIAIAKAYSTKQFSFNTPTRGKVQYRASLFDGDDTHTVRYAYAGADANALTIALGQKLGLETVSRDTAMSFDPLIKDVETEKDKIVAEAVQRAFLSSIQTQAADPNAPWQPEDFARFGELVETNRMNIYAAAQKVNDEAKERQAKQAAGEAQGAEAQPGLSMPGAPGAPVPPNVGDIGPSVGNLSQMLTQLRRPQMTLPSEQRPTGQPVMA